MNIKQKKIVIRCIIFLLLHQVHVYSMDSSSDQTEDTSQSQCKILFQCSICDKRDERRSNIKRHILNNHHDKVNACLLKLKNNKVISQTTPKHLGKTYRCEICDATFFVKESLKEHLKRKSHKFKLIDFIEFNKKKSDTIEATLDFFQQKNPDFTWDTVLNNTNNNSE